MRRFNVIALSMKLKLYGYDVCKDTFIFTKKGTQTEMNQERYVYCTFPFSNNSHTDNIFA